MISAAACRSAASSCRATAWVRLRRLSWFAGETGSKASRMRTPSRNEVRAPNSACTRSSSGVQRAVNSAQTGEIVIPVMGTGWRQRQALNRGASTSTVPNKVCSRRVRRSLSGCSAPHSTQARWWAAYSATLPHSMLACSLTSSALVSDNKADLRKRADHRRPAERHQLRRRHLALARLCLQPHRPLHHARPRGQASARPISPPRASRPPQVFDTPMADLLKRGLTFCPHHRMGAGQITSRLRAGSQFRQKRTRFSAEPRRAGTPARELCLLSASALPAGGPAPAPP